MPEKQDVSFETQTLVSLAEIKKGVESLVSAKDDHEDRLRVLESQKSNDHEDRIRKLERAKWVGMGAAAVVGGAAGNLIGGM